MKDELIENLIKKKIDNNEEICDYSEDMDEINYNIDDINEEIPKILYKDNDIPFKNIKYVHDQSTIDELMGKNKPDDDKAFVIIQDGGVGDSICATPMIESAKKNFPDKIIVVGSSHAEILEMNPNIDYLYHLASPGDLFERWVKPLRHFGSVIKRDIYNICAHKLFPGPLSMIWCHLYGVPYIGDNVKIYLHEKENEEAIRFLKSFRKPTILIHPSGARLLHDPRIQITPNKDWFMDYWIILVKELTKKFSVIQVGGANEEEIPGCTCYLLGRTSVRQTAALVKNCLTYIGIDSFVAHCGAAVNKRGIVLFGRSNPYIAGHVINKNIWVKNSCELNDLHCGRPQGYFGDAEMFEGNLRPWVCPVRSCMRAIKPKFVLDKVNEIVDNINVKECY